MTGTGLTKEQGEFLLHYAREVLRSRLSDSDIMGVDGSGFSDPRATFVTLKHHGALRGCIGTLTAYEPLIDNIKTNVINAAFYDNRFPPLGEEEFKDVSIEISILTLPVGLSYDTPKELPLLLNPGVDGVVLKQLSGNKGGTFLPQVWKQLPSPVDFLDHLCKKAGLTANYWMTGDAVIEVYQVQSFKEERQ